MGISVLFEICFSFGNFVSYIGIGAYHVQLAALKGD